MDQPISDVETAKVSSPTPELMERSSVGKPGTPSEVYERNTWPELARLAKDLPEAGIHFQGEKHIDPPTPTGIKMREESVIYRREKDVGTATGDWFAELLKEDAWFKDVVPNVSPPFS